jgi:hypothetical protein
MIERVKDVELHQLNQSPTIIKFLPIVPTQFDSEINENTIDKRKRKEMGEGEAFLDLKLIAVGCNKGTIVFLRTACIDQIYTRVTFHREAIIGMDCFRANNYSYLLSYCSELSLKIVRFDSERANCIHSIYTGDSISLIRGL